MNNSLLAIKEDTDEELNSSSVTGSVKEQIRLFKSRLVTEKEPIVSVESNPVATFLEEESDSADSVSSSESPKDPELDRKLAFIANKNIRQTLLALKSKRIQIQGQKRRITLLMSAFERKSELTNSNKRIHSKAISRVIHHKNEVSCSKLEKQIKQLALILLVLVLVNNVLSVLDIETYKSNIAFIAENSTDLSKEEIFSLVEQRSISPLETVLRALIGLLVVLELLVVTFYYVYLVKLGKMEGKYAKSDNIYSTGLWNAYCSEAAVLAFCPSIYADYYIGTPDSTAIYSVNALLNLCSFLKLYTAVRAYKKTGKWYDKVCQSICANSNVTFTWLFALKAEFSKTTKTLFFLSLSCISVLSYSMSVFTFLQMSDSVAMNIVIRENNSVVSALYTVIDSFCRVGAGDLLPKGALSRLLTVFSSILGLFFFSLLVAVLQLNLNFTPEEKKALKTLKRLDALEKIENKATAVILSVLVFNKTKRNKSSQDASRLCSLFVELAVIKRRINHYMKAKNDCKHIDLPIEQNIIKFEGDLKVKLSKLHGNIVLLDKFTEKFKEDYKEMFRMYQRIKDLVHHENKLGERLERVELDN